MKSKTNAQLGMNYKTLQWKTSTGFLFGTSGYFDNVYCFCFRFQKQANEDRRSNTF